ncbi:MAG: hypothetical protein LQ351_005114 [Letrouitia transgressa]|nr:MAG: hypothetical protein LQ351_005114 [Letrouitia transgressa]
MQGEKKWVDAPEETMALWPGRAAPGLLAKLKYIPGDTRATSKQTLGYLAPSPTLFVNFYAKSYKDPTLPNLRLGTLAEQVV